MALARIQASIIRQLQQLDILTQADCDQLINTEESLSGNELEQLLMESFEVTEFQILLAKCFAFQLNPINLDKLTMGERTFEKLEPDFCRENKVVPVGVIGGHIVIAISNPFNLELNNKIQSLTGLTVSVLLAVERQITEKLSEGEEPVVEEVAGSAGFGDVVDNLDLQFDLDDEEISEESLTDEESGPIIQLANRIIEDAYYSGGSDIHIEPFEKECRVRVRVDGVCQHKLNVPSKVAGALLARLKVMSNLDIAEKRLPQDGRIIFKQYTKRNLDIDLRVSTAPLNHGEGVVMRILDKQKSTLPLTDLGFEPENLSLYRDLIQRPYGMVLHCGPTGSGKSMTLYSALNEINTPDKCIRTAEDPIEYTLAGLCQMQMQRKIGLTFASALRAFLRQDPDIILVGEIRDAETANIAVEAALTGHMLFSTLHTNDAPGTVARLTDMGVEPFMISASLVCVCAQRLMRRLDKVSKVEYEPEGRELDILRKAIAYESGRVYRANPHGLSTGYKGRVGIHEVMSVNEEIVKGINDEVETAILKKICMRAGMRTLHQDSMQKVVAGITSMEEAIATVPPDLEDLEALKEEFALEQAQKEQEEQARKDKFDALHQEKS